MQWISYINMQTHRCVCIYVLKQAKESNFFGQIKKNQEKNRQTESKERIL